MKEMFLLMAANIFVSTHGNGQNILDSAICRHLANVGLIEKAINTTEKVDGENFLKNTNYFYSKKNIIRISNSITLEPVIFGCYVSHSGKYLLINLKDRSNSVFYFYGGSKFINELEKLKHEIIESIKPSLSDEDQAALIGYLSSCYL